MSDIFDTPRVRLSLRASEKIKELAAAFGRRPSVRIFEIFDYERDCARFLFKFHFAQDHDTSGDLEYRHGDVTVFVERNGVRLVDGELDFIEDGVHKGFRFNH